MPRNFVVLRRSPDWLNFDLRQTRAFCESAGLPADTITSFVDQWDAQMKLSYCQYRDAMKRLSLQSAHAVENAIVVSHEDLSSEIDDSDLLYFTDDDDWVRPDLFARLRANPLNGDGYLWNSIFVGMLFSDTEHEKKDGRIVQERPASRVVYTNNYAVTGAAWKRLGPQHLLEHSSAQSALDSADYAPTSIPGYFSAANKHLCCTVAIAHNRQDEWFRANLPGALRRYVDALSSIALSENTDWIRPYLAALERVTRGALRA